MKLYELKPREDYFIRVLLQIIKTQTVKYRNKIAHFQENFTLFPVSFVFTWFTTMNISLCMSSTMSTII